MKRLRQRLGAWLGLLIALVILFEEWGWEPLQALLARAARLPPLAWLERRIAALPSYAALLVLALPVLAVLPLKLFAVWLMTSGHALAGLLLIVAAKLGGTAVLARLFSLTQPALMRMPWFARWYARWLAWKNALLARVRASPVWRQTMALRDAALLRWRRWMSGAG